MYKFIVILSVLLWIFVGYLFLHKEKKQKKPLNRRKLKIVNYIYTILIKIPIIRRQITEIKNKLYDNYLWEDNILIYKSVVFYLESWFVAILSFIFVCFYFINNLYVVFTLTFFCYYVKVIFLELLIGDDTNLLSALMAFNTDLQQNFSMSKDVDIALDETNEECDIYIMKAHSQRIQDAIKDEFTMDDFHAKCTNEFLQLLGLRCYLTKEFGDAPTKDNPSAFIEGITFINEDIQRELYKRTELKYWLKRLPIGSIIPLLFMPPYEKWIDKTLPIANTFYGTSSGFISKIIITVITIIIFYILKLLSSPHVVIPRSTWEEKLLNIKFVRQIVVFFLPKKDSKKYLYYKNLINKSNIPTRVEWIYLRKILAFISTLIISICLCFSIHNLNYKNILNNNSPMFNKDIVSIKDKQIDSVDIEKDLILSIDKKKIPNDIDSVKTYLKNLGLNDRQIDSISKKVILKTNSLSEEHVSLYELALCLGLSFLASELPVLLFLLYANVKKFDMQREINLCETVVLNLMNYDECNVELILEYLSKFSDIFKNPIDRAINKLQKGNHDVLSDLIDEVNYKPFTKIIKYLMKADDIPIVEAFAPLVNDRHYYASERKESDKKIIYQRVAAGRGLYFVSILLVVICYISFPLLIVSSHQMDNLNNDLNFNQEQSQLKMK